MSDLGNERLQELTDLINSRLKEFAMPNMAAMSLGYARVAHDVIKKWYEEKEVSWAMQHISEVTITAEMALKLSKQGYELGYEAAGRDLARVPVPAPDDNRHRDEAEDKRLDIEPEPKPPHIDLDVSAARSAVDAAQKAASGLALGALRRSLNEGKSISMPSLGIVIEPPASEPDSVDAATGIADDDWCGDEEEPEYIPTDAETGAAHERMLREREQDELAQKPSVAAILGPEHILVAPLVPRRVPDPDVARANIAKMLANGSGVQLTALATRKPRTLAEVDGDERPKGKHGAFLPTLDDVIRELKRQSMAGMMPSQSMFNDAKPGNWAIAVAQTQRLKKSWEELAKLCGLKLRQRGPQPQSQAAK